VLDIEAIGRSRIKVQMKAHLNNEQRMFDEKAPQLGCGSESLADADQEGFEIGAFRMGWTATHGALGLPLLNQRPIE
jgi:hypothetical protein